MKMIPSLFLILATCFIAFSQQPPPDPPLKPVQVKDKWGYADRNGRVVIPAQFDTALPFNGKLARVGMTDTDVPEIRGEPNFKWGYIDEAGRVVVELRYNSLRDFSEGLAAAAVLEKPTDTTPLRRRYDDLRWGYVDMSGTLVVPLKFFDVGDFSEGLAPVNVLEDKDRFCERSKNFGYIDTTGAMVIEPRFGLASAFKGGRARVGIGEIEFVGRCVCCAPRFKGQYGYVDRSGTFVADKADK